jgi:hypothetical protein
MPAAAAIPISATAHSAEDNHLQDFSGLLLLINHQNLDRPRPTADERELTVPYPTRELEGFIHRFPRNHPLSTRRDSLYRKPSRRYRYQTNGIKRFTALQ